MNKYWDAYDAAENDAKSAVLDAIAMIKTGRLEDGVALLERYFLPTWQDIAECEARYREVMGRVA